MIISINDKGKVYIYIDSAYIVYIDGQGHSSIYLAIEKSEMINIFKKLGVITTSSTETEVTAKDK